MLQFDWLKVSEAYFRCKQKHSWFYYVFTMPFVYDDIYEICKERRFLIDWLQGRGLLGDFSGICECCFEGKVKLVEDKSYS